MSPTAEKLEIKVHAVRIHVKSALKLANVKKIVLFALNVKDTFVQKESKSWESRTFLCLSAFRFVYVHCLWTDLVQLKGNKPSSVQMWWTMQMWKIALCRIFFIRSHDPLYWMSVHWDFKFVTGKWATDSGQDDQLGGSFAYVWKQLDK